MSFVDDVEMDLIRERGLKESAIEKYMKHYRSQAVVDSALQSFRKQAVNMDSKVEEMSKNILITIARTKRVSEKQKKCLIRLLVNRETKGYEY